MKRVAYLDRIRALAMIFVVAGHLLSPALALGWRQAGGDPAALDRLWPRMAGYMACAACAVGPFFLASGAMLLRPPSRPDWTWRGWWARRFGKMLPPFALWSFLFLAFGRAVGFEADLPWWRLLLPPRGAYYHLWFMYTLLAVYLAAPLALSLRLRLPRGGQWAVALSLMAAGSAFYLLEGGWVDIGGPIAHMAGHAQRHLAYLGLFWTGALLADRPRAGHGPAWLALAAAAVAAGALLARPWLAGQAVGGGLPEWISAPAFATELVAAIGLFQFIRWADGWLERRGVAPRGWTSRFGEDSFGVYILHVFPLWLFMESVGANALTFDGGAGFWRWFWPVLAAVLLVSWGLTRLLKKTPAGKWLVP